MSGYCWSYDAQGKGKLGACNRTNSYCCLPTPPSANPLYPEISFCSPQYNQTDVAGSIPDIVPNHWGRGGSRGWPGAPTWSSAYVIIPGVILQYGRDGIEVISKHYDGIKAHMDFLARQATDEYGKGVPQFGMLGDWCSIEAFCPGSSDGCLSDPGWTSGDATSAFYYVKDLEVLVQLANATGNHNDASKYSASLEHARVAYHKVFFNTTSEDFGESQTGNALGILASPKVEPGAVKRLLANLANRSGHLSVGAVGARWILQALTAANETAAALDLATKKEAPSWYWFVENGPGTLHENWPSGPTPDGTTGGSQNHPMFGGGVDVWIYHEVAGLRGPVSSRAGSTLRFGVESVILDRVGAASAYSKLGGNTIASAWVHDRAASTLFYNLTVPVMAPATVGPAGVQAHVTIPTRIGESEAGLLEVREAGALVWSAASGEGDERVVSVSGVGEARLQVGTAEVELLLPLGAGRYSFTARYGTPPQPTAAAAGSPPVAGDSIEIAPGVMMPLVANGYQPFPGNTATTLALIEWFKLGGRKGLRHNHALTAPRLEF